MLLFYCCSIVINILVRVYKTITMTRYFVLEIQCPMHIGANDDNLAFEVSSTKIGSSVPFSCPKNMYMTGQQNITCNSSGLWEGDIPQCNSKFQNIPQCNDIFQDLTLQSSSKFWNIHSTIQQILEILQFKSGINPLFIYCLLLHHFKK